MSRDALEIDQEDFYGRLLVDEFLSSVALLYQRKGVTENDVLSGLSVFNDRGSGKLGAIVIVLMPSVTPESANTPSPYFKIRQTIQVIEMPLVNLDASGTGLSAERIAQRVRQIFQVFSNGLGGSYAFAGMEPITVSEGQISYGISFTRLAGDPNITRVAQPTITADVLTSPATITMACATIGAAIWYTTDGSYPSSMNPSAMLYSAPFGQSMGATIRAAAQLTSYQQSCVASLTIAQGASSAPATIGGEGGETLKAEGGETLSAEG